MKKKIRAILKYSLFLIIGGALVWWQISGMTEHEREEFIVSLEKAKYIYLVPIVIMSLFSHFFRALRWRLLINPIKKVSVENAFYSTIIGYLGNNFVPRAGELLRCTILSRYEKVKFSSLFGTVIVERVFDLLCFTFFIILTIAVQLRVVGSFVRQKTNQITSDTGNTAFFLKLSVIITGLLLLYFIFNRLFTRFPDSRIIQGIKKFWIQLKEGTGTIFHLKEKRLFLIYTGLIWLLYLMQIYLGFRTIDITEHLGLGAAMSVLTLSTLAMIISPGGLGAFPIAVQQVLLVYGVNNISFGWLVWGVNTLIIIVAGVISFVLIIYQNRKRKTT